jgi:hypothetical protein
VNKLIVFGMAVLAALGGRADSYVYSVAEMTNGQVATATVPASGWLDKVEISQFNTLAGRGTCSVEVATFAGSEAIDVLASASALTSNKVIRTRVIGTGNSGTALAASHQAGLENTTNMVGQILVAPYERPMIGGNTKIKITNANASNDVKVVLYYLPLQK